VGDQVYLSTQNMTLSKGRAMKLVPQYIGPYHMTEAHNTAFMVTLELPENLENWHILLTFHTNLIRQYIPNNDAIPSLGSKVIL
jgi:hypothetical protein